MRAAVLTGFRDTLTVTTTDDPDCPADGVVIKVLASGICRSDWHCWVGADPDVQLPHIPGHEYCGEIVAIGSDVRNWSVGDRVIAPFILACGRCSDCAAGHQTICATQVLPGFTVNGSFAEYIAAPHADANLSRLPDNLEPAVAAALGCRVTTAWHALTGRAALKAGEWLAVFGGGGIGLSAMLLGRALGARVAVVDVVPEKLEYAKSLGADAVFDARRGDVPAAIKDVTNGGADIALEALGIEDTTRAALGSLRKLGRMVQVGMPTGPHATMEIPMDQVYSGQLALYGTRGMPSWRYPSLLAMISSCNVDFAPLVTRRVALSDVTKELAAFDGPAAPGVAVITEF